MGFGPAPARLGATNRFHVVRFESNGKVCHLYEAGAEVDATTAGGTFMRSENQSSAREQQHAGQGRAQDSVGKPAAEMAG